MKRKLVVLAAFTLLLSGFLLGVRERPAGAEDAVETQPVEVMNEVIKVTDPERSFVLEILGAGTDIEFGNSYRSPYFDVREYRHIAFYVYDEKVLNAPAPEIRYQLDAYFSIMTNLSSFTDFQSGEQEYMYKGWNEFGGYDSEAEGQAGQGSFRMTTTGETSARVLVTPIYGPFVRVELKNLSPGDRRKFKITAYLTR